MYQTAVIAKMDQIIRSYVVKHRFVSVPAHLVRKNRSAVEVINVIMDVAIVKIVI